MPQCSQTESFCAAVTRSNNYAVDATTYVYREGAEHFNVHSAELGKSAKTVAARYESRTLSHLSVERARRFLVAWRWSPASYLA